MDLPPDRIEAAAEALDGLRLTFQRAHNGLPIGKRGLGRFELAPQRGDARLRGVQAPGLHLPRPAEHDQQRRDGAGGVGQQRAGEGRERLPDHARLAQMATPRAAPLAASAHSVGPAAKPGTLGSRGRCQASA